MANIFGKLKQIKELRSQAKQLQGAIGNEVQTGEHDGVKVTANGNFELTEVKIDRDLTREQLSRAFQKAANDAIKKMQKVVAQKVQAMGGLEKFTGK